jgi:hypothetical protein
MQIQQLSPGGSLHRLEPPYKLITEQGGGIGTPERPYQENSVLRAA